MSEDKEDREEILLRYRGLREEDLPTGNVLYACIICRIDPCKYLESRSLGRATRSGPCCEQMTEEEFSKRYDFR